jgi:predicted kinase
MATAHLIHGYLCVGKTTIARQLADRLHAVRFSPDEWMIGLYGDNDPDEPWSREQFDDYSARVRGVMDEVWPDVLRAGGDVILDFGFWGRRERDLVRSRVRDVGAEAALYRVDTAEATARERCSRRNEGRTGAFHIDEHAYDILRARFEPLGPDESCTEISTDR